MSSLFMLGQQNYPGLDDLTSAVINNEIKQFRAKVERIKRELDPL